MSQRFASALEALLTELGVSHAELGRRLHKIRKSGSAETWRRQVVVWANGTVTPREASVQLLAEALTVPRSRLPETMTDRQRLLALQRELEELRATNGAGPTPAPQEISARRRSQRA